MTESSDVLSFPEAKLTPLKEDEIIENLRFEAVGNRKDGTRPGDLTKAPEFGCYKLTWDVSKKVIRDHHKSDG